MGRAQEDVVVSENSPAFRFAEQNQAVQAALANFERTSRSAQSRKEVNGNGARTHLVLRMEDASFVGWRKSSDGTVIKRPLTGRDRALHAFHGRARKKQRWNSDDV